MSTPPAAPTRSALIVHAHPEPDSFSSAQAAAVAEQLRSRDVQVHQIDLYAEGWDPVLAREHFMDGPGYFKPQAEQMQAVVTGTLDDPVAAHLRQVQQADLLVLSFPLWWFSMPAIMKGWVDRVFVMGATFGGEHGIFERGGLRGKKAIVVLTTGGAQPAFAPAAPGGYGDIDAFLFHIHRGMLEFVGYDVLPPVITYGPTRLDGAERAAALAHVQAHIANLLGD
ncbi:NAD(P)H-dependent oxidoreductase [Kineococcus rhizosphaerae]|uniref:NAD(P)H dehydrogenase (Quinone) n=1 Tax=Kineococcus rhizosphaerae TaxID=559628 RepID=A0A2T0R074_9ACTN|nr:NAD(P)H-dependent oxidoreductase [Kineococcus rhizosphaerae]PRY12529.1 NAD(P)H dehydrogenase (quinone) [Kineococcus rhizosphaerae]